jgi:hypothetical protein
LVVSRPSATAVGLGPDARGVEAWYCSPGLVRQVPGSPNRRFSSSEPCAWDGCHTIRHADRILFHDYGHIVEDGTHDTLLGTGGRYAQFWNARAAAAKWHLDTTDAELSPVVDR